MKNVEIAKSIKEIDDQLKMLYAEFWLDDNGLITDSALKLIAKLKKSREDLLNGRN